MKPTVGAVICTYDDSGHLTETVRRVYNSLDRIYILIGTAPWSCSDPNRDFLATYATASSLFDPEQKITIVSRRWASEHEQRAYGQSLLFKDGIDWCMVLDDDEFYNTDQLDKYIATLNKADNIFIYLVPMHVYWKTGEYILSGANTAYPVFVRTDPSKTEFTKARAVIVKGGNWESSTHSQLAMHHLSYVRTDEQVHKKVTRFSHADQFGSEWLDKWKSWQYGQDAILDSGIPQRVQKLDPPLIKPCGYVAGSHLEVLLHDLNSTVDSPTIQGDAKTKFLLKLGKEIGTTFRIMQGKEISRALGDMKPNTPYVHIANWEILIIDNT